MARSQKEVIQAIFNAHGIISVAAQNLGLTRDALYKRMQANEKIRKAVRSARERMKDFAESKMYNHINSKNEFISFHATKFYLSTQCKDRGYYTKVEKEQDNDAPIIINYNFKK